MPPALKVIHGFAALLLLTGALGLVKPDYFASQFMPHAQYPTDLTMKQVHLLIFFLSEVYLTLGLFGAFCLVSHAKASILFESYSALFFGLFGLNVYALNNIG